MMTSPGLLHLDRTIIMERTRDEFSAEGQEMQLGVGAGLSREMQFSQVSTQESLEEDNLAHIIRECFTQTRKSSLQTVWNTPEQL